MTEKAQSKGEKHHTTYLVDVPSLLTTIALVPLTNVSTLCFLLNILLHLLHLRLGLVQHVSLKPLRLFIKARLMCPQSRLLILNSLFHIFLLLCQGMTLKAQLFLVATTSGLKLFLVATTSGLMLLALAK